MTKREVMRHYGNSQAAVGRALKISRQAVHLWKKVPPLQQVKLEALTGGLLKADPDCWQRVLQPNEAMNDYLKRSNRP